jgi:lysophospholipase L1-like esterase
MYPRKTLLAIGTFVGVLLLPQVVPALSRFHWWDPRTISAVWEIPVPKFVQPPPPAPEAQRNVRLAPPKHLEDPHSDLEHFYAALLRGGLVRVLHYGDSPTTADLVTGDVRTLLQKEFGDGGLGFTLIARPWAWYSHRGLDMNASGWKIDIAGAGKVRDGLFGLGGATFQGQQGAAAHWRLRSSRHRQVEVAYLAQPGGGSFSFEADGVEIGTADTGAEEPEAGFATFDLPEGSARYTLRVTEGPVRLFGVEFRKSGRGVIYSSLGINGASVTTLSRAFNGAHWAAQLRHYQPDLVVVGYGTNEAGFSKFVDTSWDDELRLAIRRLRAALPKASILLMSPMDRGERNEQGEIATIAALPRLVLIERQVAAGAEVAFFNTFQAMGGEGTMARWYAAEPRLVGADFIHPLPAGGRIVGELLVGALRDGFQEYKLRQLKMTNSGPGAGADSPAGGSETEK